MKQPILEVSMVANPSTYVRRKRKRKPTEIRWVWGMWAIGAGCPMGDVMFVFMLGPMRVILHRDWEWAAENREALQSDLEDGTER